MKKFLQVFVSVILTLIVIAGCSSEQSMTEEEIRAEIEAEAAAVAAMEEEIRAEIKAELDAEAAAETAALLTFGDIYDGENLVEPLEYFDSNFESFEENEKIVFAQSYMDAYDIKIISNDLSEIMNLTSDITTYGPIGPLNTGKYYSYYSMETSTIDIDLLSGKYDYLVTYIQGDPLLTLAVSFWADSGSVNPMGIEFNIEPEYYISFHNLAEIAGEFGNYDYFLWCGLDGQFDPNLSLTGYPEIMVDQPEDLELFYDEDMWKATLYLPIDNVMGTVDYTDVDNPENGSMSQETLYDTSVLEGFVNETINGDYIDFSEYSAVVSEMYMGDNMELLELYGISIGESENAVYSIALFGRYENVTIYYYADMYSTEEPEEITIGSLTNTYLVIGTEIIEDVSRLCVHADVIVENGGDAGFGTNFYGDDGVDDYYPITWE